MIPRGSITDMRKADINTVAVTARMAQAFLLIPRTEKKSAFFRSFLIERSKVSIIVYMYILIKKYRTARHTITKNITAVSILWEKFIL